MLEHETQRLMNIVRDADKNTEEYEVAWENLMVHVYMKEFYTHSQVMILLGLQLGVLAVVYRKQLYKNWQRLFENK